MDGFGWLIINTNDTYRSIDDKDTEEKLMEDEVNVYQAGGVLQRFAKDFLSQ